MQSIINPHDDMKICGLKLTHDSAISLIEDGKLVFSIELEKISNNNRFKILDDTSELESILNDNGVSLNSINKFVIDGWVGLDKSCIQRKVGGKKFELNLAPYHEKMISQDILTKYSHNGLRINDHIYDYYSYTHVAGHIFSSYCTSPFSKIKENSLVLVWDGGMHPRLYSLDAYKRKVHNLGEVFYLGANLYSIFAQHFGPFKLNPNIIKDELSIAGKVMAFTAVGKSKEEVIQLLEFIYYENLKLAKDILLIPQFPYLFAEMFKEKIKGLSFSDEDVIASFHDFMGKMLIDSLAKKIKEINYDGPSNLCFVGGAGLNIKWNSLLRSSGLIENLWICPFPNDSGSAIGAACCFMFDETEHINLEWNVYQGPKVIENYPNKGWTKDKCDLKKLALLINETAEPIIILNDRAELGPRALGNRSIIAPATKKNIKDTLNWIKYRESYRPIAPICLEQMADQVFDPGCKDPYMLYEHKVKHNWIEKLPGISHSDKSARLQTVNANSNPIIFELLMEYYKISGIPVLCNTSANFKGSGFFPDIESATRWGKVNYVWCNNYLYQKDDKVIFHF